MKNHKCVYYVYMCVYFWIWLGYIEYSKQSKQKIKIKLNPTWTQFEFNLMYLNLYNKNVFVNMCLPKT